MVLRRHTKRLGDADYTYGSLVRTVRTAKGPRHELVAQLGKLTPAAAQLARAWSDLDALLDGTPPPRQLPRGREAVAWEATACVLSLARFCAQPSELAVAERWYADSALADLLGVAVPRINQARLYRGLDMLLEHKEAIGQHLLKRYQDWFGLRFEFLIDDVTSTDCEGLAEHNELAARGHSRDHRSDCKQVCSGLVVTPAGLPVADEVFAGHRADVTTVTAMVELLEQKYGQAQRVWAMDRGMVSEANLAWLREREALYLVGTPQSQLRQFEKPLLEPGDWHTGREGLAVKLVAAPDGQSTERYVLCRSPDRGAKERAMLDRQIARLREECAKLDASLQKKPLRQTGPVERRIGKWLGRYPAAAKLFTVNRRRDRRRRACGLEVLEHNQKLEWARQAHGAYLLRTNHAAADPAELRRWYVQLTQAEGRFGWTRAIWDCGRCFTRKPSRCKRPSWSVSWRWRSGGSWSSGWRARVWARARGHC